MCTHMPYEAVRGHIRSSRTGIGRPLWAAKLVIGGGPEVSRSIARALNYWDIFPASPCDNKFIKTKGLFWASFQDHMDLFLWACVAMAGVDTMVWWSKLLTSWLESRRKEKSQRTITSSVDTNLSDPRKPRLLRVQLLLSALFQRLNLDADIFDRHLSKPQYYLMRSRVNRVY